MKFAYLILAAVAAIGLSSCGWVKSTLSGQLTPDRMKKIDLLVTSGTHVGGSALLAKHPEYREALTVSAEALGALVAGDKFEPAYVDGVLRKKLNDELTDPVVAATYNAVMDLVVSQYRVFWTQNSEILTTGKLQWAAEFLNAARSGLLAALAQPAATPTPNPLLTASADNLKL